MARSGTGRALMRATAALVWAAVAWVAHAAPSSGLDYPSAWECDATKFNWYCIVEEQPQDKPEQKAQEEVKKPKTKEQEAMERLEQWKKELEAKRALAVMDPSAQNVKAYIEAQERLMQTASTFSDVWRRVIWQNPKLNYELRRPVNAAGLETYKTARKNEEIKTLQDLGKEWGIFFFFRSDCPYCHRMSATLKLMTDLYGIQVFPVSLDGGGLPEYPNPRLDNGMASMLGITQVPTMVLGNPKDKRMVPIGSGVVAVNDLIERIYILTKTRPGDNY